MWRSGVGCGGCKGKGGRGVRVCVCVSLFMCKCLWCVHGIEWLVVGGGGW